MATHRAELMNQRRPFRDHLRPAVAGGGFRMDGYFTWCGSAIHGDDGRYHLFASHWPDTLAFHPHWLTNSAVIRASSPTPEGPYTFEQVVVPPRGKEWWDGRMTHNPTIHHVDSTYLLYYTGTTYDGPTPTPDQSVDNASPQVTRAHANQRIGLATAPTVQGPWTRRDQPLIEPRPDRWDGLLTTNPAPCVLPDGRILLIYKSTRYRRDRLHLGLTAAEQLYGPYTRLTEDPILRFNHSADHVEDPYLWQTPDGGFEMVMKDMRGGIGGERRGGVHARSADGITWSLADPPQAYSRTVLWSDAQMTTQDFLERPQLLIRAGRPTHLFLAAGNGGDTAAAIRESRIVVFPLDYD